MNTYCVPGSVLGPGDRVVNERDKTRAHPHGFTFLCVCVSARTHAQSGSTVCKTMDCNLSGFSVHGILQARMLEWVAISYSKGSSQPRDQTYISYIGRWIFFFYHCAIWEAQRYKTNDKENR